MGKRVFSPLCPAISNSLSNDDGPELYVQLLDANWIVDNTSLGKEELTPLACYYLRTLLIIQPTNQARLNEL